MGRCFNCGSISYLFLIPQDKMCSDCVPLERRVEIMGYVPVKPKKDFKRPQLMEDENVY